MNKNLLILVFCLLGFSFNIVAQEQESDKKDREKNPSQSIEATMLAGQLAHYGYAHRSALSLVEAVNILSSYSLRELTPEKSEPSTGKDGEKVAKYPNLTVDQLLKDAKVFAKGNNELIAVIDQVEKKVAEDNATASRGRTYGPARVSRKVYGHSSYTDYIKFNGGELAEVAAIGDGDTDLDLIVYDSNGNLIESDLDYTDRCYVSFYPRYTGTFRIVVKNRGDVYNRYTLLSN